MAVAARRLGCMLTGSRKFKMEIGAILIPKGTVVTGRIRRFARYVTPSHHFVIALEWWILPSFCSESC